MTVIEERWIVGFGMVTGLPRADFEAILFRRDRWIPASLEGLGNWVLEGFA